MNIDELTIGQVKQIQSLLGENKQSTPTDPLIGKYVICRCYSAGVHAGELVSQEKDVVLLKDSRRLWNWKAKDGVALSGVAQHGLQSGCKIDAVNPLIRLTGVIETILTSDAGKESINEYK